MITDKDIGQSYLVVTGEKGVGKTCLLRILYNILYNTGLQE
jgi:ABC-type transport system involved in cytochrome c biogenesis ATPase subunit